MKKLKENEKIIKNEKKILFYYLANCVKNDKK
jgi:hypothetical protein